MKHTKLKKILGWSAVVVSTVITCMWAFWGAIENFHEGWYSQLFWENIALMFAQYLSPMLIFLIATLVSIRWTKIGASFHFLIAVAAFFFFGGLRHSTPVLLIFIPFLILGLLYFFGEPEPKRLALKIALVMPLLTMVASGIYPAIKVAGRVHDGNLEARLVEGNGVRLVWAPAGAGWLDRGGKNWEEAKKQCSMLSADGKNLTDTPQNIWRLPSVDEVVRSMARHGRNSGGVWDDENKKATYKITPDKETPLWNKYSMVIYWWTATEADERNAYMIVYDGNVWKRNKRFAPAYFAFRCVKEP